MVNYAIARRLARECEVSIYANRGEDQKRTEYAEGIFYRRISVAPDNVAQAVFWRLPRLFTTKRPFFASSIYYLGYILKASGLARLHHCDVVHTHNFSQFIPIIRRFNPDSKIIIHMHCEWLSQLDAQVIREHLRNADLIIGCSNHITNKIRARFPEYADRCHTVYNGVDMTQFTREHERSKKQGEMRRLLWVGRVSPEKGLHILLHALKIVIKRRPNTLLEIVGPQMPIPRQMLIDLNDDPRISELAYFYDRDYLAHLQEQAQSLGIERHVNFVGMVPHVQLAAYYENADLYVHPSFSEAFPLTLLEAMANALPVVSTNAGGIPESVEHARTGLLVEPGDVHALAEAILQVLSDEDMRRAMGCAGSERVAEHFTWNQASDNLLSLYKKICNGRK